jgi:hypothetical protein
MTLKLNLPLLVLLVVAVSGCTTPQVNVVFIGSMNASHGNFSMNGSIQDQAQGEPDRFEEVVVSLYSQNGTVLNRTSLGTIEGKSRPFRMNASRLPKYIIIDSPDFWTSESTSVAYYVRTGDEDYTVEHIGTRSELPVTHNGTR